MTERRLDRLLEEVAAEILAPLGLRNPGRQQATLLLAGAAGVALGLALGGAPPASFVAAVLAGGVVIVAVRLWDRWRWPWQVVLLAASRQSRRRQIADLGTLLPADLEGWLEDHPPGTVDPRWRAGAFVSVGRTAEARQVIAGMSKDTGAERLDALRLVAAADAVDTGEFDERAIASGLGIAPEPDLTGSIAPELALLRAAGSVDHVSLRRLAVPSPVEADLGPRERLAIWRVRVWPLEWFAAAAIITRAVLALLRGAW